MIIPLENDAELTFFNYEDVLRQDLLLKKTQIDICRTTWLSALPLYRIWKPLSSRDSYLSFSPDSSRSPNARQAFSYLALYCGVPSSLLFYDPSVTFRTPVV